MKHRWWKVSSRELADTPSKERWHRLTAYTRRAWRSKCLSTNLNYAFGSSRSKLGAVVVNMSDHPRFLRGGPRGDIGTMHDERLEAFGVFRHQDALCQTAKVIRPNFRSFDLSVF